MSARIPQYRLEVDQIALGPADTALLVVVLTRAGRSAGIVVDRVLDIVEDREDRHADVSDRGLVGSTVIGEHVVELLDVDAAVLAADPAFHEAVPAVPEPAGAVA